jgi:hypothetical protein
MQVLFRKEAQAEFEEAQSYYEQKEAGLAIRVKAAGAGTPVRPA